MDFSSLHIPLPLAFALIAALGYFVGLLRRYKDVEVNDNDVVKRSVLELKRARLVASDLEKITMAVQKSLLRHNLSIHKFKQRVDRLSEMQQEIAWKELCREADEILKPTQLLASQIANAYDEIRQQSAKLMAFAEVRTDPLTAVKNRRGMDDALIAQFALMDRYETPFTAAIFDIDNFKLVNDKHGHLYGDQVLQQLSKVLSDSIRETDILARYGGEEFVIIMPETDLAGASLFCDRLREKVERSMKITISGGLTPCVPSDTKETLLARADAALYQAKAAGRNRVFAHNCTTTVPVGKAKLNEMSEVATL
jgi:diguanylate cyclase (GGDEF)-like protein